jgi:F420-non-reducing hydrogenase large subunit
MDLRKFPYLKKIGWKGFVDGPESGLHTVSAHLEGLTRQMGMATPLAQEEYEFMYKTLAENQCIQRLAYHWARLIELLYAAERAVELKSKTQK